MSEFEEGLSQLSMNSNKGTTEALVEFNFTNLYRVDHAQMVEIALRYLREFESYYSNATMEFETITGEVRNCRGCSIGSDGLHIPGVATYNPKVIKKMRLV